MQHGQELASLIAIADGTLSETRDRLTRVKAERCAEVALEELIARTVLFEAPQTPVTVQFELTNGTATLDYHFTLGGSNSPLAAGRVKEAPVVIRQDLAELLRALYGTERQGHDATRVISIMNEPGPKTDDPEDPWLLELRAATLAAGGVSSACSQYTFELGSLARKFGSDKWGDHFYTRHYDRHFAEFREQRIKLLEIGIGGFESPTLGGESLRMWKYYFRRGMIYGLDVFDKSPIDEPRIHTIMGDQSDPECLKAIADGLGPLDIIIDDGSHLSSHIITSFTALFPYVIDGGLYVIEDLHTSYWPGWNGNRNDVNDPATTIGFLKTLLDGLHYQDQMPGSSVKPSSITQNVRGIHIYHNIAFIEKGAQEDQTAPSWVRRYESDMDLTPKGSMVPEEAQSRLSSDQI